MADLTSQSVSSYSEDAFVFPQSNEYFWPICIGFTVLICRKIKQCEFTYLVTLKLLR
jgi:hypothetical protein